MKVGGGPSKAWVLPARGGIIVKSLRRSALLGFLLSTPAGSGTGGRSLWRTFFPREEAVPAEKSGVALKRKFDFGA